jgi:hypothetical protein
LGSIGHLSDQSGGLNTIPAIQIKEQRAGAVVQVVPVVQAVLYAEQLCVRQ